MIGLFSEKSLGVLLLAGDPVGVRGHQITLNDASLGLRIEEGRSQVR